ncbi:phytoene synthase [Sphingomonas vulcanisoli]|uniref:Phytoene synthase n=1 Tax=Sphingomonas vulcanisoli TaxID=1658060 RepID=A0ABX0TS61_9SPHN|nr:squalene/phytoene synthase family protein [Sphingomonas vulcanisoli]NIJ08301.1 phytoene synthase [Sphingomonas vulcanisoli]
MALVDPERALAVAYAPADKRAALTALFALDERMGAIVGATKETHVGLIRLAWWRESLERLDHAPPPAEPLLGLIAAEVLPLGVTGKALAGIEHGWSALLDGVPDAAAITRHGQERGMRLFRLAARLLSNEDARAGAAGEGWALADLGHRHSDAKVQTEARAQARAALSGVSGRWPRALLPLAALARLARIDADTPGVRRQGSPGRLMRLLALRLTRR